MAFLIITLVKDDIPEFQRTRRSVVEQSLNATHMIIDSSIDSTELLDLKSEENVVYVRTPPSSIYQVMNSALGYIETYVSNDPHVLFLNSGDELFSSTVLEDLSKLVQDGDNWFYTNYRVIDITTNLVSEICPHSNTMRNQLYAKRPIHHQAIFVKASVLYTVGKFDEAYKVAADWDYISRLRSEFRGRYIDLTSTNFELGGFSSANRKQGNIELYLLRRKFLHQSKYESILSFLFYLYRTVRIVLFFKLFQYSPRLLRLVRILRGWRKGQKRNRNFP